MINIKRKLNIKLISVLASFALIITSIAANQRCWFIMYDEKMPSNYKKLWKF